MVAKPFSFIPARVALVGQCGRASLQWHREAAFSIFIVFFLAMHRFMAGCDTGSIREKGASCNTKPYAIWQKADSAGLSARAWVRSARVKT